jgi:ABC-type anion transport system duplicated permease subunit
MGIRQEMICSENAEKDYTNQIENSLKTLGSQGFLIAFIYLLVCLLCGAIRLPNQYTEINKHVGIYIGKKVLFMAT